jgi:hypothetical protein
VNWKFWKRSKKSKTQSAEERSVRTNSADRFSRLPKAYAQQQILALQRIVGNRAVLRLLGVNDGVATKHNGANASWNSKPGA